MKTETREINTCDYCNKRYLRKKMGDKHELACSKNPVNDRPCFHCANLVKKEYKDDDDYSHRKIELFFCGHYEHYLYPPSADHKKNWVETGDSKSMPKECDFKADYY